MQNKEKEFNFDKFKVTGLQINYYFICKRKLWLFSKKMGQEYTSDKVLMGKILHDDTYNEYKKDIYIDNLINIDIIDNKNVKEVKSSDKMKDADKMQIIYYLYFLKNLGIERKGIINYPKIRKREFIELTNELELELENILIDIKSILSIEKVPEKINEPFCKKCAYYEFCYV